MEQYRAIVSNLHRGKAVPVLLFGHHIDNWQHAERNNEENTLRTHAALVAAELSAYQSWLHCYIDGIETDKLLIRFSHVDEANLDREFSFVLDVSEPSYNGSCYSPYSCCQSSYLLYAVITTTPLPKLPILLNALKETGNIYRFIKLMRIAFSESLHPHS